MHKNYTIIATVMLWIAVACFNLNAQEMYSKSTAEEIQFFTSQMSGNEANKWDYFIYPVPAVDVLNIKVTKGNVMIDQIIITDEDGNEVMTLEDQTAEKIKLDLEELKPGKYIIQIVSNEYKTAKMKRFYVVN